MGSIFLSQNIQPGSMAQTVPYSMGIEFFPGIKRQWSDVHHLSPSSVESKNVWNYTSTPPIRPNGMYRNKFTFTVRDNDTVVKYP
jgi:hypothetical protein